MCSLVTMSYSIPCFKGVRTGKVGVFQPNHLGTSGTGVKRSEASKTKLIPRKKQKQEEGLKLTYKQRKISRKQVNPDKQQKQWDKIVERSNRNQ